jgi:hypothetical protein
MASTAGATCTMSIVKIRAAHPAALALIRLGRNA